MRSPFDWVVSEKDFPIEDDRFCRFCGRRLEYRDSLYCMCLPDDYDYRRHPDSCGADAANEPEEELTPPASRETGGDSRKATGAISGYANARQARGEGR